jgi:hypothetical protein
MKRLLPILGILISSAVLFSCQDDTPYYDVRDEYIGDYDVFDQCESFDSDYSLTIYKEGNDNELIFGFPGLYETGYEVVALATGMKITIPIQQFVISTFPAEVIYEFSGSGSLEGDTLIVDYQVLTLQNGLIFDEVDCTATMVRIN